MNIFDYPHIKEAILNVANDLKYKGRACVIATMGIGKSAIASFLMVDNKDKKILFAAPTNLLLEQMQGHLENMGYDLKKDFADLKFMTYSELHAMIKRRETPEFDFFICDEFHAIAKRKRYESIKKLFTYDEGKMYLGLSATPILQWEYEYLGKDDNVKKRVNMASVLYDDNVSFFYSLDDALANGLFSEPEYNEFFVILNNPRDEAIKILKNRMNEKDITEEQINALTQYLEREAGIEPVLDKYLEKKNTKIMFYCRDFKDLLEKEKLLKRIAPELSIYKTSCRLPKKENKRNIEEFRNNDFVDGNSKVLLSIRQVAEGFHTDGKMQIVFASKTHAYRDFLQKFGRGCSLGNKARVKILDLGGNLTRISSLDFLRFKDSTSKSSKDKYKTFTFPRITLGGNIVDLNNYIESVCRNAFVSDREKADIYYDRIITNGGYLKDEKEKYKDGTYLKDWYKTSLKMAKEELRLYKSNPNYRISSDKMYVIEILAFIDNYLMGIDLPTPENKRDAYMSYALEYKNLLPRSEEYRFKDGVYMATWYNQNNKRVRDILKKLENPDYQLSNSDYELLKWFRDLHNKLMDAWLDERLGSQRREQEKEKYKNWEMFSEAINDNPKLLSTKKLCEGIETFYCLEDYYAGVEKRMTEWAISNFAYSTLDMEKLEKRLILK